MAKIIIHPTHSMVTATRLWLLPAGKNERWIDSEDTIRHQNVPSLTAALKLAGVGQRGF